MASLFFVDKKLGNDKFVQHAKRDVVRIGKRKSYQRLKMYNAFRLVNYLIVV